MPCGATRRPTLLSSSRCSRCGSGQGSSSRQGVLRLRSLSLRLRECRILLPNVPNRPPVWRRAQPPPRRRMSTCAAAGAHPDRERGGRRQRSAASRARSTNKWSAKMLAPWARRRRRLAAVRGALAALLALVAAPRLPFPHGRHHVRQHMAQHRAPGRAANRLCGLELGVLLDADHRTPDHTRAADAVGDFAPMSTLNVPQTFNPAACAIRRACPSSRRTVHSACSSAKASTDSSPAPGSTFSH